MKRISFSIVLLLVILSASCSRSLPEGLPKLFSVQITITQDGKPLDGALVSLEDPSGNIKFTVGGTTNSSGIAELFTHGSYQGAPIGKYKVRVMKDVMDERPPTPPEHTLEYAKFMEEWNKNPPQTYMYVEKQYSDVNTTPLEIEVTGKMTQTLDVGKAVKIML